MEQNRTMKKAVKSLTKATLWFTIHGHLDKEIFSTWWLVIKWCWYALVDKLNDGLFFVLKNTILWLAKGYMCWWLNGVNRHPEWLTMSGKKYDTIRQHKAKYEDLLKKLAEVGVA